MVSLFVDAEQREDTLRGRGELAGMQLKLQRATVGPVDVRRPALVVKLDFGEELRIQHVAVKVVVDRADDPADPGRLNPVIAVAPGLVPGHLARFPADLPVARPVVLLAQHHLIVEPGLVAAGLPFHAAGELPALETHINVAGIRERAQIAGLDGRQPVRIEPGADHVVVTVPEGM